MSQGAQKSFGMGIVYVLAVAIIVLLFVWVIRSSSSPSSGGMAFSSASISSSLSFSSTSNPDVSVDFAGSNAGGHFEKVGFTKDHRFILYKAVMGDPGAGGGSIDFGYAIVPAQEGVTLPSYAPLYNDYPDVHPGFLSIAPSSAIFFDDFGKVLFVTEGDNAPSYGQPGPANNAHVVLRDLTKGTETILLAEKDTTYKLLNLDSVYVEATHYTFSDACPRAEGSLYCAKTTTEKHVLKLP